MKKSLLLVGALVLSSAAVKAQTIFSEDFNAATTLPAGWVLHNVDGFTPATNVNFVTDAWVVRADATTPANGNICTSTSWYTPAGAANDWIVTPAITVPGTGTYNLIFDAQAPDANYADGYQVYVSTTGTAVADFTAPAISTVAAATATWTPQSVSLAAYAGQTIYIAIVNNSNDMFLLNIDNVVVKQLQANDANLTGVTLNRYSATSTNNTLSAAIKNDGSTTITSVTLNWNDGTDHSQVISTNIASGATATVNHPTAVTYASVVEKNIVVTITAVNAGVDPNTANNGGSAKFNTLSSLPAKRVVFEEGTGTWCGFCVRGAVAMEYMTFNHSDFIGIAVHNGDPMTVTEYDANMNLSGFPGANVDRSILGMDVSNTSFEQAYNDRKNMPVPAALTAVVSGTGSTVVVDASATFKTVFANANYRLALAIVEDSVQGTTSGYDQHNYYNGGTYGALTDVNGLDYTVLPATIPHDTYKFNHVARAIVGGFAGVASSVPTSIADGAVATHTFNYTIPAGSNRAYMRAVLMLVDQDNGEIVNGTEVDLSAAGLNTISTDEFNMNVYPNPTTDVVNVSFKANNADYSVSLTDLAGKVVLANEYTNLNGTQTIQLPVNNVKAGSYLVTITSNNITYTQHVVIK
ncbi:MAG: choice-of-anchor J domain-containing protein [Flavobacteriia bacterium]|nr:choice-of-anchor J domain-containing protein [Flavobacteriia bacterium]